MCGWASVVSLVAVLTLNNPEESYVPLLIMAIGGGVTTLLFVRLLHVAFQNGDFVLCGDGRVNTARQDDEELIDVEVPIPAASSVGYMDQQGNAEPVKFRVSKSQLVKFTGPSSINPFSKILMEGDKLTAGLGQNVTGGLTVLTQAGGKITNVASGAVGGVTSGLINVASATGSGLANVASATGSGLERVASATGSGISKGFDSVTDLKIVPRLRTPSRSSVSDSVRILFDGRRRSTPSRDSAGRNGTPTRGPIIEGDDVEMVGQIGTPSRNSNRTYQSILEGDDGEMVAKPDSV